MLGQSHRASLGEELQTFSHLDGHTMARLVSIALQVRSLNPELHHSKGHDRDLAHRHMVISKIFKECLC